MNYGPVWIDLQGTTILDQEIPLLQHRNTGGVLLFTKNYENVAQLKALVVAIRKHAGKPVIIAVDHEGGRKWRFDEGFTKPAAPGAYGTLYEKDPEAATEQLYNAGQVVAHELLNCGVDLTFAPLLDLDHGISEVIGDRSYNRKASVVIACARAFVAGLKQQGMGAVGKHYPGHGGCTMDSHFTMAHDTRTYSEIEIDDLLPFTVMKNEITGIMPAHVVYPEVDPFPAGFSKFWLQTILRNKIGFTGAIISDCLSMRGSGVAEQMAEGAVLALNAGCDMVIASQQTREYLLQVLDGINWQVSSVQQQRIKNLAGDYTNPNLQLEVPELDAITG
jgi:beta-N-acetylhexosaminidase